MQLHFHALIIKSSEQAQQAYLKNTVYLPFVFLRMLALCCCTPYKEIDSLSKLISVLVPQFHLDNVTVCCTSFMKMASESLALLFTSAYH